MAQEKTFQQVERAVTNTTFQGAEPSAE
jgi:hypothetical protein